MHTIHRLCRGCIAQNLPQAAGDDGFGFTICCDAPVRVQAVEPGGPAQAAGLRQGDSVLQLNSLPVETWQCVDLAHTIRQQAGSCCLTPPTVNMAAAGVRGQGSGRLYQTHPTRGQHLLPDPRPFTCTLPPPTSTSSNHPGSYGNYQNCTIVQSHVPCSYGPYSSPAPKTLIFPVFVQPLDLCSPDRTLLMSEEMILHQAKPAACTGTHTVNTNTPEDEAGRCNVLQSPVYLNTLQLREVSSAPLQIHFLSGSLWVFSLEAFTSDQQLRVSLCLHDNIQLQLSPRRRTRPPENTNAPFILKESDEEEELSFTPAVLRRSLSEGSLLLEPRSPRFLSDSTIHQLTRPSPGPAPPGPAPRRPSINTLRKQLTREGGLCTRCCWLNGTKVKTSRDHQRQAEIITDQQRQAEIITNQQRQAEIITDQQRQAEIITDQQRQAEIITDQQRSLQTSRDHYRPAETSRDHNRPAETSRDHYRPAEIITDQQRQAEIITDQQRQAEIITDQQRQAEIITDQQRSLQTSSDKQRSLQTSRDKQRSLQTSRDKQRSLQTSPAETSRDHYRPAETSRDHYRQAEIITDQQRSLQTAVTSRDHYRPRDKQRSLQTSRDKQRSLQTSRDKQRSLQTSRDHYRPAVTSRDHYRPA
ncbi:Regulator of G-protein signaling 3 [Dissostichus eleginoides]|uniref:Regulator of G-protein signaling 3 n=1 Tax=Dissostichus eleginoides TaxID=100907 RepID=A0AAD9EP12_DISEL|nr:Regulator of G-protein signaling 3 [Dissostichus eleginoides]